VLSPVTGSLRGLLSAGLGPVLLAMVSCTSLPPTVSVAIPPIPAGEARVWFYRDWGPYDALGTPYLRINEAIVGVSEPGGAFYRDVAPGQYHVTVDNYLSEPDQFRYVYLFPGQQAYFMIVSVRNWIAGGGNRNSDGYQRDTFYVWEMAPEVAQGDILRSQLYGGG
jgi:hypothetical protein